MKVEIFGTPSCKFCEAAKSLCRLMNITFSYEDISSPESREEFEARTKTVPRSVPQIIVDNVLVGSFNDFKNFLNHQ